jgi:hypothetical protein
MPECLEHGDVITCGGVSFAVQSPHAAGSHVAEKPVQFFLRDVCNEVVAVACLDVFGEKDEALTEIVPADVAPRALPAFRRHVQAKLHVRQELQNQYVWAYLKDVLDHLPAGDTDYTALRPDVRRQAHPETIREYRVTERRDRADRKQHRRATRRRAS